MADPSYSVASEDCIRCASCSTLAPGLIAMGEKAAVVVRQPSSPPEQAVVEAALLVCPVFAIRKRAGQAVGEAA